MLKKPAITECHLNIWTEQTKNYSSTRSVSAICCLKSKTNRVCVNASRNKTMQINKNALNYKGNYKFSVNKTCESPGTYCTIKDYFLEIKMGLIYDRVLIFKTAFLE